MIENPNHSTISKCFHVADGLYFSRGEDGSVTLTKRRSAKFDDPIVFETRIDDGSWCSVVASVSMGGDTRDRWNQASEFHSGGPAGVVPESVKP